MLEAFLCAFLIAACATLLVIRSAVRHSHVSGDHDLSGPQKLHMRVVPRVGGLGLFVGYAATSAWLAWRWPGSAGFVGLLALCSLPAFCTGLAEDVTKRMSPRRRLFATAVSAALGAWLLGAVITRTDIPGLDLIAAHPAGAVFLALFVVAGVSHSINIIDGLNGLASMCSVLMLLGLAYVAGTVGDTDIAAVALALAGAVLGFFMWNYPRGLIFLGDGGAYLLGFMIAELGILLVHRNPQVSPLCPLLIAAYPIFETLFSMYRRRVVRGRSVGIPDGIHLHTLIYKRLMRWALGRRDADSAVRRNSMAAPYLWVLCSLSVVPAVLWWDDSRVLSVFMLLFVASYVLLYRRIVHFRTPRMLVLHRRHQRVRHEPRSGGA